MPRFFTVYLLATLFAVCVGPSDLSSQDAQSEPTSAPAKKAKAAFLDDLKKLDEEHERKVKELRQQYVKALDQARKEALEKSNLDEAQRILASKTAVEEESKAGDISVRDFRVLSAKFGTDDKWVDVTGLVQKQVKGGKLVFSPVMSELTKLPDPAPFQRKAVAIVYSVNGRVSLATVGGDRTIELPPRR